MGGGLKRTAFNNKVECCRTCMFIDEYSLNVNSEGEIPTGYDGTAICGKYDSSKCETNENRLFVSPSEPKCWKYCRCTKRQADYLDIFDPKTQTIIENPYRVNKQVK